MSKGLKWNRTRHDDTLSRIGWDRLECVVADHYRAQGYDVEHVGTGRADRRGGRFDGGIDLKMRNGTEYVLVQCKHWNACQVPHNDVHEFLGIVVNQDADRGIVITSGEFTPAAIRAAGPHGRIELIDGNALRRMIGPLPEEAPSGAAVSEYVRRLPAAPFVANAAERLVSAAEDRIRHGTSPRTAGRAATAALSAGVVKIAILGLVVLGFLIWVNTAFDNLGESLTVRARATPAQAVSQPAMTVPDSPDSAPIVTAPPPDTTPEPTSRAYIGQSRTPAEQREWERRQAESMKIIESSTPEMQRRPVMEADASDSGFR